MSDSENKTNDITEKEVIDTLEDMENSPEVKTKKGKKKFSFAGLKKEYGHITWLTKKEILGGTVAVVSVSVIVCIIIALVDYIIQLGLNYFIFS